MKKQFKRNFTPINQLLILISKSTGNQSPELELEWRTDILRPYLLFLYTMDEFDTNVFSNHASFVNKVENMAKNQDIWTPENFDKIAKQLNDLISDWLENDLDTVLKKIEWEFYTGKTTQTNDVSAQKTILKQFYKKNISDMG